MKFFELTDNLRTELTELVQTIHYSSLLSKEAYRGEFQAVEVSSANFQIVAKMMRQYPNEQPHRTNTKGELILEISSSYYNGNIEFSKMMDLINWHYPLRPFRLIIPSNLLSDDLMKQFIAVALYWELPTFSTETEQIIYFTEIVDDTADGFVLLNAFPQIIKQSKPIE